MRRSTTWTALLFTLAALTDCQCGDDLRSTLGELHVELCDSNATCASCEVLEDTGELIEFGAALEGTTIRRNVLIVNENPFNTLVINDLSIDDPTGAFTIETVEKHESAEPGATVLTVDLSMDSMQLFGEEQAEVYIAFNPIDSSEVTATLTINSNSVTKANWELILHSGPGEGEVTVAGSTCPNVAANPGDPNCRIDCWNPEYGAGGACVTSIPRGEAGFDFVLERPTTVATETITVTNSGDRDLYIGALLTDDGVPEADPVPGEPIDQVGDFGVFWLQQVQCSAIAPQESIDIVVEFRPSDAGTYRGEVKLIGLGSDVRVELIARVTGPKVCITTEDDAPNDTALAFGVAPLYDVAQGEVSQLRRVFLENCGYDDPDDGQDDFLDISDITTTDWDPAFLSTELPWSAPAPLEVGETVELPFTFEPTASNLPGQQATGRLDILTNATQCSSDNQSPTCFTSYANLIARVGAPRTCLLVAAPAPVDFGWAAADEAQGTCPPAPFPCPVGPQVSRTDSIIISNVGQRDCTGIDLEAIIPNGTEAFTVSNNPYGGPFTLMPFEVSQPIEVTFLAEATVTPVDYGGLLPLISDDLTTNPVGSCPQDRYCVELLARGGGNPNCTLEYQPIQPPGLFCPQETLAFGNVNIGQTKTIDLKVINAGSDVCNITSIAKGGNGNAFTVTSPATPVAVAVNDFITVPVSFNPVPPNGNNPFEELDFGCGLGGLFGGGEKLVTNYYSGVNSGNVLVDELPLAGRGTRPDIDVIPGEVDFGEVQVGCCSATQRVAIYNSGDGTLDINQLGILASSDLGYQVVDQPTDTSLSPGEDTEFSIRWCATGTGPSSGVVEIESSDDNDEYFTVPIQGEGVLDAAGEDDFAQPDRPKVDVLWVVDDSGSMGDEQTNLANNFDTFITTASSLDTDYHLGVVNTDAVSDEAGKLYSCNGPLWITDTQPVNEQRNQFKCNVKTASWPRPNSDSKESALQAARLALDYPNIDGHNVGFYRDDAKLYIILVTDEDDQSDGTAQQYVDYFQNLKGVANTDLLNISAITGETPNGCATAAANPLDEDAVALVGGQFLSICTPDWSGLIASLGLDVFNARRQFPLSRPATGGTIFVEVCDAGGSPCNVVPQDPANGWTFDPVLNSITFNGTEIPGAGEEIHITYVAVCYQ